jgi:hypothetical protein
MLRWIPICLLLLFAGPVGAFAQSAPPPAPPQVIYVPVPAQQGVDIFGWLASPFVAAGQVVGATAAAVGNVVATPFIVGSQAWQRDQCWQRQMNPQTGQTQLFWVCR